MAILVAAISIDAATYYKISVAKQWHQTMSSTPTTAAAVGGYVFGVNSSNADASTTFYYSHATYNSSEGKAGENNGTNGSGTLPTISAYYSQGACAVDDAGHFLLGKSYTKGAGIRWVYVFQPASNGKSMTYLGAITLPTTADYAGNDESEMLAFTASGDVTKDGGKIYLCPKGKNYLYRFTCAGGYTNTKSVTKFKYSPNTITNGDYASFRWYETNTGLLNLSNNGVTDKNGSYKCVFSGSTATLTDFDGNSGTKISGNNWRNGAYNCGATLFKIRGHLILVGAVNELEDTDDPKKSMAFWDVTDGDPSAARRIIDYATMGSWPGAPYMWQNAIKASDDHWDVYTYFKTGRAACYKVTAAAATVTAPTVSLAAGTYNNNQTCTITWPSTITVNGKSLAVTLYYSTDNGSTYSTATGGSKAITISKTCTLKAYCQLTSYDNKSSTVSRAYTMKCATPTFSKTGGGTSPTTVTISSATTGATIYYTTDGSTPTTSSASLSNGGSFVCSAVGTVTIKAIAVKTNYTNSAVGSITATYNPVLAAPTIIPSGNTFNNDIVVSITATAGATIYYRLNGGSWQTYTSGVNVTADNTTVEAYAAKTDYTNSTTTSQTYNLECAMPTLSVGGGTYSTPQTVTITSATAGATIYYSTGSGFNTLANGGSITLTESCNLSVFAKKTNYQDSELYMTSYVINASPSGAVSDINLSYSPVIGKSTNNPTADLIRFDGTVTFTPAPATSNGWTLDKYIVTVSDGTNYAQNVSGAYINGLVMNADVNTIPAQNFKVGSTYTVSIAARYVKEGSSPYDVAAATSSVKLEEYATYTPTMSVQTYVTPRQEHYVWWGDESEPHKCYFDVYRVELTIDDAESISAIPVSYYQLQMSKDNGKTWINVTDRTIDAIVNPAEHPVATYPTGFSLAAGRFPGNYNFTASQTIVDAGTAGERRVSVSFYYAFDVTSKVSALSVTDPTQDNPATWVYRLTAVYGAGEDVTDASGNPVTTDTSKIQYNDGMSSSSPAVDAMNVYDVIITGVDGNVIDPTVKEVRYYDLRGIRLQEMPRNGFYIEVRLYNDGRVVTEKRLAR